MINSITYGPYPNNISKCAEVLSENQKVAAKSRGDTDADKYFDPLQAACETRQPKLMEIALDAIHFLIGNCGICHIRVDADANQCRACVLERE